MIKEEAQGSGLKINHFLVIKVALFSDTVISSLLTGHQQARKNDVTTAVAGQNITSVTF